MDILNKLGIKDINFGGCSGPGNWTKEKNDGLFWNWKINIHIQKWSKIFEN